MAKRNPYAFKPYQPPPIPSGSYDPALDASRRAASRGLQDTTQDTTLAGTRAGEDYGFGQQAATGNRDNSLFDLGVSRDNSLFDINRARGYEGQDYTRDTNLLTRQFGILAGQQAEGARKYGVTSGGIALLSAAKRQENQGIQQGALDTAHTRAGEGFDIGAARTNQAHDIGAARAGQQFDMTMGGLGTDYNRGVTDRTLGLSRAGREDTFFGADTEAQKAFQAGQAGYSAPQRGEAGGMPKNQFTRADGSQYRIVLSGGKRYIVDPSGKRRPA